MSMTELLRGLVVVVLVFGGWHALLSWLRPYTNCGRCAGRGWRRALLGGQRVTCRACAGQGERLRPGRRLFNYLRHTRAQARIRSAR